MAAVARSWACRLRLRVRSTPHTNASGEQTGTGSRHCVAAAAAGLLPAVARQRDARLVRATFAVADEGRRRVGRRGGLLLALLGRATVAENGRGPAANRRRRRIGLYAHSLLLCDLQRRAVGQPALVLLLSRCWRPARRCACASAVWSLPDPPLGVVVRSPARQPGRPPLALPLLGLAGGTPRCRAPARRSTAQRLQARRRRRLGARGCAALLPPRAPLVHALFSGRQAASQAGARVARARGRRRLPLLSPQKDWAGA
uniref:Uncharacterized protein n=1 Tax=Emiliania huxleyi (strain CCMP1516) TaxID=280463 RepID=A0A0D3JMI7_EMIH1